MNKRIQQLAEQAGARFFKNGAMVVADGSSSGNGREFIPGFSKLLLAECRENIARVWYEQGLDLRGADLEKFLTRFDQCLEVNNEPTL